MDNRLGSLDLSACKDLKTVECNSNRLVTMEVRGCGKLKALHFQDNRLGAITLPSLAELDRVGCQGNVAGLAVNGRTSVTALHCGASSFAVLPRALRATLQDVQLEGLVTSQLTGFRN